MHPCSYYLKNTTSQSAGSFKKARACIAKQRLSCKTDAFTIRYLHEANRKDASSFRKMRSLAKIHSLTKTISFPCAFYETSLLFTFFSLSDPTNPAQKNSIPVKPLLIQLLYNH